MIDLVCRLNFNLQPSKLNGCFSAVYLTAISPFWQSFDQWPMSEVTIKVLEAKYPNDCVRSRVTYWVYNCVNKLATWSESWHCLWNYLLVYNCPKNKLDLMLYHWGGNFASAFLSHNSDGFNIRPAHDPNYNDKTPQVTSPANYKSACWVSVRP